MGVGFVAASPPWLVLGFQGANHGLFLVGSPTTIQRRADRSAAPNRIQRQHCEQYRRYAGPVIGTSQHGSVLDMDIKIHNSLIIFNLIR